MVILKSLQRSSVDKSVQSVSTKTRLNDHHLFDCVRGGQSVVNFRELITRHTDIHYRDEEGRSILMFAAQIGHLELFQHLLTHFPSLVSLLDVTGQNVMHFIASSPMDDASMVTSITKKKLKFSKLIWMRNTAGELPKDIALRHRNRNIFKAFQTIMVETASEYRHIARTNCGNRTRERTSVESESDEDMDLDYVRSVTSARNNRKIPESRVQSQNHKRKRTQMGNVRILSDVPSGKRRRLNTSKFLCVVSNGSNRAGHMSHLDDNIDNVPETFSNFGLSELSELDSFALSPSAVPLSKSGYSGNSSCASSSPYSGSSCSESTDSSAFTFLSLPIAQKHLSLPAQASVSSYGRSLFGNGLNGVNGVFSMCDVDDISGMDRFSERVSGLQLSAMDAMDSIKPLDNDDDDEDDDLFRL